MSARRISTNGDGGLFVGGWLSGESTYLWIGIRERNDLRPESPPRFVGTLSGHKLYRLAKAIVRQYEDRP